MKSLISKGLLAFSVAIVITMTSGVAEARRCTWVPGHWENGYFQPGHRVCYGYGYGYRDRGYYRDRSYYREDVRRCWWRDGRRFCR